MSIGKGAAPATEIAAADGAAARPGPDPSTLPCPCNLVFLGPPGAGKGTVTDLLCAQLDIPHISTGEMFRRAINAGSELGRQVAQIIRQGRLVPDQVTVRLVRERLAAADVQRGYLLDGFPRTLDQAQALGDLGPVTAAIDLVVSDDEIVRRLTGRRVCAWDGETYHLENRPPRLPDVCDRCGRPLIQRDDDQPEAIRHRLQVYQRQTAPLTRFYRERGLLHGVDGSPAPERVRDSILDLLPTLPAAAPA
jgi:adenylate kinase